MGYEKKRAQTLPSPLWKDRSGRLPGTALSITSPGESYGSLPKRRALVSNLWAEPCACKFLFRLQRTPSTIQFFTKAPTLSGLEWVGVSQRLACDVGRLMPKPVLPKQFASGAIRSGPGLPGLPATTALAYVKMHRLRHAALRLLLPANHRR